MTSDDLPIFVGVEPTTVAIAHVIISYMDDVVTMESIIVVSMMVGWCNNDGGGNIDGRNDGDGGDWNKDEGCGAMDSGSGDMAMRAVVVTRITCYNR